MSFQRWKDDLEQRLALHLFNNPEKEKALLPPFKRIVNVEEMPSGNGWTVKLDGKGIAFFYGPTAHTDASAYAGKLANEGYPV